MEDIPNVDRDEGNEPTDSPDGGSDWSIEDFDDFSPFDGLDEGGEAATATDTKNTMIPQSYRAWQVPALGSKGAVVRIFLFKPTEPFKEQRRR